MPSNTTKKDIVSPDTWPTRQASYRAIGCRSGDGRDHLNRTETSFGIGTRATCSECTRGQDCTSRIDGHTVITIVGLPSVSLDAQSQAGEGRFTQLFGQGQQLLFDLGNVLFHRGA